MRFKGLRKRRISLYTGLQLGLFVLCWVINLSPAGLAVAFLIVALVPLRERLLPRIFSEAREWANTPSPFPPLPCAILTFILHPLVLRGRRSCIGLMEVSTPTTSASPSSTTTTWKSHRQPAPRGIESRLTGHVV